MNKTKKTALLFLPFMILGLVILFTDPYELPLVVLLLPFLLLGWGVYTVVRQLAKLSPLSERKARFIAAICTGIILLATLLQSIRQLSVKDFLIMAALLIGVSLYVRRVDI